MKKHQTFIVTVILGVLLAFTPEPKIISAGPENFDGDPYADLAIGAPYEDHLEFNSAGSISVLYGSYTGLTDTADEYWLQDFLDGSDTDPYDYFGLVLAVGDFDGDQYYDLAVGVPYEDVGGLNQAGAVNLIYGSRIGGLSIQRNQYWNQDEDGISDSAEATDHFGGALAAGDFNGDGFDDLAIGVPNEDFEISGIANAGAVHVLYGSQDGLTVSGSDFWHQDVASIHSLAEAEDRFGFSLSAGDFDGDGFDDLAVGVPYEHWNDPDTGILQILYGTADGLTDIGNQLWRQGLTEILDEEEPNDRYAYTLASGDFNGDDRDDLAIGIPDEDIEDIEDAGAVNVLYGSQDGISSAGNHFWHQDVASIHSLAEAYDRFGFSLSSGDFDADGHQDLAVGVPYEDWNDPDTGIVQILFGTADGLTDIGNQLWRQDTPDIEDREETEDQYGYALAAGDFNGDLRDDLAIGIPFEDTESPDVSDAGAVNVLFGSGAGLIASGNQFWYQGKGNLRGEAETFDLFGYTLAALPRGRLESIYLPLVMR